MIYLDFFYFIFNTASVKSHITRLLFIRFVVCFASTCSTLVLIAYTHLIQVVDPLFVYTISLLLIL